MYKVAVLGDKESIYGFTAIGFDVFFAENSMMASDALNEVIRGEQYAIVFVTEMLAADLSSQIIKLNLNSSPAIILIPGVKGNTGEGMNSVKRAVLKAVGSDVI